MSYFDPVGLDIACSIFVSLHSGLVFLILGSGLGYIPPPFGRVGTHVRQLVSAAPIEQELSWTHASGGVRHGPDLAEVSVDLNNWVLALDVAGVPNLLEVAHPCFTEGVGLGVVDSSHYFVDNSR